MTSPADMRRGLALRAYLLISHLFALVAPLILRRRLKRGKEHPTRWPEKQGLSLAPRPEGPLIWLHAVGLGEVLSLRGLIIRMAKARPDISFLVTSTTAASAEVFIRHTPPRTRHQFLPIDAPAYRRRFLDHFAPDLCVWAEQDLWPGLVSDAAARHIPQAVVAARMNTRSFRSHRRARPLYRDLYQAMALVTAQDSTTADHLRALGAQAITTGSLKPAAPPLEYDPQELDRLKTQCAGRFVWAVAPAHPEDIHLAQAAHAIVQSTKPDALLIIAPRFPDSFGDLTWPRRSAGQLPGPSDPIWLCDTLGDLGLVYRLTQAVLIGGTFGPTQGHNPWEAAALDNAIFHGPNTANFIDDYDLLAAAHAALRINDADSLAAALTDASRADLARNAMVCTAQASIRTDAVADAVLALLDRRA